MNSNLAAALRTLDFLPRSERLSLVQAVAESREIEAIQALAERIMSAPGANDPDRQWFDASLKVFANVLATQPDLFDDDILLKLQKLEDIGEDCIAYSMDDRYDVAHDFRYADYSEVRRLAADALRSRLP